MKQYSNLFKKELCEKFLNSTMSVRNFASSHNIPYKTFEKWELMYKENDKCFDDIEEGKIRPVSNIIDAKRNYSNLSQDELLNELMLRDIELERLKKNYSVQNISGKKAYVTFSRKNTK